MIIFDLICSKNHIFEGWFGSSEEYFKQKHNNLLLCPHCGSSDVQKSVMAPNIGLKSNQKLSKKSHRDVSKTDTPQYSGVDIGSQTQLNEENGKNIATEKVSNVDNPSNEILEKTMIETLTKVQNELLKESIWVGHKFTDEVRAIHYGESDHRKIHGHVSEKQASELTEEGIDIAPLPMPYIPPDMKN